MGANGLCTRRLGRSVLFQVLPEGIESHRPAVHDRIVEPVPALAVLVAILHHIQTSCAGLDEGLIDAPLSVQIGVIQKGPDDALGRHSHVGFGTHCTHR